MPIYEYQCKACAHQFESLVLRGEVPACEACGGLELDRLLSLPNVKSESTKALGAQAARRRDAKQGEERVQEQIRYERSHND
jgi:putative FmdB family regulatory protein